MKITAARVLFLVAAILFVVAALLAGDVFSSTSNPLPWFYGGFAAWLLGLAAA